MDCELVSSFYITTSLTLENKGSNINCKLLFTAKEKPKTQETAEQLAIRMEIRKEWGSMKSKL